MICQNKNLPQCPGTMNTKRPNPGTTMIEKGSFWREKSGHIERAKNQNDIKVEDNRITTPSDTERTLFPSQNINQM